MGIARDGLGDWGVQRVVIGPVFAREAVTTTRRPRHYLLRSLYVSALLILMCTAWLALTGAQLIRNVGDTARFGSSLFQILAPLQLTLVLFLSALGSASAVAQEKDRRTLVLLLLTRMSNSELVLGKLLASLLDVLVMLVAAFPLFLLITLFGGVSFAQVGRVFGVTFASALAAGSLGSTVALWREKTFQSLSVTALALLMWAGAWEAVYGGLFGERLAGVSCRMLASAFSPFRAVMEAARPDLPVGAAGEAASNGAILLIAAAAAVAAVLNLVAIARVRVWNPSREAHPGGAEPAERVSIWGVEYDLARSAEAPQTGWIAAEAARAGHVDARQANRPPRASRRVWDNPILWREVCTWAYGRKVLLIRIAYLILFAMVAAGLHLSIADDAGARRDRIESVIPASAKALAPFFLVSLVILNALAVTSITNERDGLSLDLLLVTDLTPKEFVLGKLGGVFWVAKEMVVLPLLLCGYLWWRQVLDIENLCLLAGGLSVMNVFAGMLGIHCGMTYASSRTAIGVSLGSVFFLFLGMVACIAVMISFSGSFHQQLPPFLAFILGGSIGLYVSLGSRNPSPAIGLASLLLPFATFYAITSFLLEYHVVVFLVVASVYGFTTAAMLIPAVFEFDIAMGRTKTHDDE